MKRKATHLHIASAIASIVLVLCVIVDAKNPPHAEEPDFLVLNPERE